MRALPNFIIIGAQKAGTTSLFYYMSQNNKIKKSFCKKVHYFDLNFFKGETWYRKNFPIKLPFIKNCIVGAASPYYLVHPHVPKRIYKLLPNTKLIILLRDPVDRAISQYYHMKNRGRENLPILDAFKNEEKKIGREWERMLQDEYYNSMKHVFFSNKQRGIYIEQIERYLKFFKREQLLIINSEQFFNNPKDTLGDVFTFLKISELNIDIKFKPKNKGTYNKKVPIYVIEYLQNYYNVHNKRLFKFLGFKYDWK